MAEEVDSIVFHKPKRNHTRSAPKRGSALRDGADDLNHGVDDGGGGVDGVDDEGDKVSLDGEGMNEEG